MKKKLINPYVKSLIKENLMFIITLIILIFLIIFVHVYNSQKINENDLKISELEKQISDLENFDPLTQKTFTPITPQKQQQTIIEKKHTRWQFRSIYNPNDILISSEQLRDLKKSIYECKKIIENIVIANVSSPYLTRAKGISIYYPNNKIDPSYLRTKFAQENLWLDFIQRGIVK